MTSTIQDHEATLDLFKQQLATMNPMQIAEFMLARSAIMDTLKRYPGAGHMALSYVSTEEVIKVMTMYSTASDRPS